MLTVARVDTLSPAAPAAAAAHAAVLRVPGQMLWRASQNERAHVFEMLGAYLAVSYKGVLTKDECDIFTDRVYAAKDHWIENFGGAQYTLGRAWYTDLEQDREDEYFARAIESDALLERVAPGLQQRMYDLVGTVVGAYVEQRDGWCGPGVHVFPPMGDVARRGGDIHFDTEGLTEDQLAARAPALSFVLMLQPAETGGSLRVWDSKFEGDAAPAAPSPQLRSGVASYQAGDLVVFDSYRMHQIQSFSGTLDRISITAHAVWTGVHWEVWF